MKSKSFATVILGTTLIPMFIGGCASPTQLAQSASAGRVGCSPSEVIISNFEGGFTHARSWTAVCNGKSYICSGVSTGRGAYSDVTCTKK